MASPLTVIVPTLGRPTLQRTLDSIHPDVETVVVADGPAALAKIDGLPGVVATITMNQVGHPQRELGMRLASGKWLAFMDDDDCYTPDGLNIILSKLGPPDRIHMFRMMYDNQTCLWDAPELVEGNVGTPMWVVPNIPEKLGRWEPKRVGDFSFIRDTAQNFPVVWHEEVVCLVRP